MKMAPAPAPTAASALASHHHHHHHEHNQPHHQYQVTEDTPVDYLEGCMEVLVIFPNEKSIPMSIQRRMPMLDLLIHVTAANKLSPAAHLLQVTDEDGRVLPQKPSTPIGSLNAHKVYIVPKNRLTGKADRFGGSRPSYQAKTVTHFEPTFRVQVRLPRNQLFVTRVTGRTQLADLLHTVCNEKDLDPSHYEFRHPVNQDERLKLSATLGDYKITEVVLVHVPLGDIGQRHQPSRHQQPAAPSPPTTPTTPTTLTSPAPSDDMSNKKAQVAYTNSTNTMSGSTTRLSGQGGAKSALRSTTSEAALNHAGEKKRRGLLGLFGFGKHKKGSSMGDSSVSSDSVGDRSISPTRSDEPVAEPVAPAAPRPPSPVLVSKRLAEEAMAKRNSRLLMSQKSAEAAALGVADDEPKPAANGSAKAPARSGAKKRMAPAPPAAPVPLAALPATSAAPPANGLAKAESEVSTYTTCSSGSSSVSPPVSVIDNSSLREATPSPNPSQTRPGSSSTPSYRTPVSHEGSPDRGHSSSNMLSTPHVSSTNLTAVSSTSNASLSSVVKKRKAPVPPPALKELRPEADDTLPAARESNGHATESDATSGVSDESASDVSAASPKSRTAQRAASPPASPTSASAAPLRRASSGASRQASPVIKGASDAVPLGPPKPAPRTRKPNVPPQSTRSSGNEKRSSSASAISTSQDNNNARRDSWPDDDDDLNFDDESLSMFASNKQRNKSDDIDPLDAVMRQQLELAALQKAELECEKRILQEKAQLKEAEKQKIQSLLHNERQELEQIQQTSALSGEQAKAAKRTGRWAATPEIRLERWSSSSDDESVGKVARDSKRLTARERRSRANSADTEFYSLSESEDKQDKEPGIETPTLWQPRLSDGSGRSDPDADFAAMCEALALRKQRKQAASSALPSDLSQVPLELLQSLPWPPGETSDYDDLSPSSRKRMWRRSNSEPGSTVEEELSTSPPAARSADNLEGLEHKKPTDPATSTLFSLNDNSFSSNSSYRGEHDGFVKEGPAPLSWQPEVESVRSSSPSEASEQPAEHAHSDDDYEVLKPHNQNVNQSQEERGDGVPESRLARADAIHEHVEAEALYSMVIKSTNGVRVVNLQQVDEIFDSPKKSAGQVEPAVKSEAAAPVENVANDEVKADDEPEVERSPEVRADSPVLWEFKLPAPPTPFADSGEGSPVLDKVSIKSDSGSTRSRHSSISTDSLQEAELGPVELDDNRAIPVVEDSPAVAHNKVTLEHGNELAGESRTEDPPVHEQHIERQEVEVAGADRTTSPPLMKQHEAIRPDEPLADESLPSLVPPLPLTLPPEMPDNSKEDEALVADPIEPPQIYQEEKADIKRERSDSHSSDSSSASSHSEPALSATSQGRETCPGDANEAVSPPPEPAIKEPDAIVNQPAAQASGSAGVNGAPAFLPLMNVDFIQQFQAALTTISDPQARALQEEFLRLQQQFLTWQLHAAAQQSAGTQLQQATLAQPMAMAAVSQTTCPADQSPAVFAEDKREEPVVQHQTPLVHDEAPVECSEAPVVQSEPVKVPAQMEPPVEEKAKSSDESSDEAEEPVYRYAGPPQVKLDTWKPGRPRSEVIDYSNTLSFNIPSYSTGVEPKSKLESKISTFEIGTASRISSRPASASPTPTAAPSSSAATATAAPSSSAVVTAPKTFVIIKAATDLERREVKSPVVDEPDSGDSVKVLVEVKLKKDESPEPKKEEKPETKKEEAAKVENEEAEPSSGVKDKVGRFESNIDKSAVLRKSSFVTPRPFEPRPVSMPIKRPAIVPAVIQPVPFVSRKMQRAPEVRGFASLPSPEHADAVKSVGSGEPGPAPFGSKARPASVASKENPTIVIRNKLIESARRPSAELEQPPIQSEANDESRGHRSAAETVEDKRPTPAARPLTMPASSSLILAASAESSPKKQPIAPVSAPPPAPAMMPAAPSTPAKRSMPSRFERKIDPREELLNSIRSFAVNGATLRKTGSRTN